MIEAHNFQVQLRSLRSTTSTELCKNIPAKFRELPLPTQKLHYGAMFQPATPQAWQESVYTMYSVYISSHCQHLQNVSLILLKDYYNS